MSNVVHEHVYLDYVNALDAEVNDQAIDLIEALAHRRPSLKLRVCIQAMKDNLLQFAPVLSNVSLHFFALTSRDIDIDDLTGNEFNEIESTHSFAF